jgi:hypothetical protein
MHAVQKYVADAFETPRGRDKFRLLPANFGYAGRNKFPMDLR